jgi:serine beta-lactamase-like protein LACTB, mitochondrial
MGRRSVDSRIAVWSGALLLMPAPVLCQSAAGNYSAATTEARTLIADGMRTSQIPALSVAVVANGKLVWSEAFGQATIDPPMPATPTTLFRVGSVSKSITAAALMRLRESGRIHLDTSVRRYVPEWPAWQATISISQLASHLSGIRHYRGTEFFSARRFETVIASLTPFMNDSLLFVPGSRFEYSTYGYTLLSAAIERAAGVPFLTYVDSAVVRPLGLTHTIPDYADSVWKERTTFYYGYPDGLRVAPAVDQSNKWAGGGYLSTAQDMVLFGAALLRPGFLTAESLSLLFGARTLPTMEPTGYGIGWSVGADSAGHRIAYHGGSSVGGTAMLNLHLEDQVVVCILVNAGASRTVNRLSDQIAHLFLRQRR